MSMICISYPSLENLRFAPPQAPPAGLDTWSREEQNEHWYSLLAKFFDTSVERACVNIGIKHFMCVRPDAMLELSLPDRFRVFLQDNNAKEYVDLIATVETNIALGIIIRPAAGKTWPEALTTLHHNIGAFCNPLRW